MSNDVLLWVITQAIFLIGVGVAGYIRLLNTISANDRVNNEAAAKLTERISRVEGFLDSIGKDFAKRLHRDDDKYGVDHLLDIYISRHHELSPSQWLELEKACDQILNRGDISDLEIIGYNWLKQLAIHKLQGIPDRSRKIK